MRSRPFLSEATRKAFAGTMIRKVTGVKTEKIMINNLIKRMNMYLLSGLVSRSGYSRWGQTRRGRSCATKFAFSGVYFHSEQVLTMSSAGDFIKAGIHLHTPGGNPVDRLLPMA